MADSAPEWTTSCPDWERRIVARESLVPCAPLFPDTATEALNYFRALRMVDVAGKPTMGEISRPWVLDFVGAVFGAYDSEDGRRLITEFFLLISKKNGKSSYAAGIMLTALLLNWRDSAEFLILAPTIEIANNSFYPARDMVKADEDLSELLHVQDHVRTITHRLTGATLKVVAADSDSVGGKKASGVLVDELWLFGKQPNAENMLREACGGLASRPEGFVIYLSTQSDAPPAGVFQQKLLYARQIRDGAIEDRNFLPVLYEFPAAMIDEKAHQDPANFYITNPNLGASVDEAFLVRELKKAEATGQQSVISFLSKHLNVEIGLNLRSDRWAGADFWQAAAEPGLTLESLIDRCEVVCVGIDGGGLDDLLGLAVAGRERGTRKWLTWCKAWAHRIVLERRKSEAPRLLGFAEDGDLVIVDQPGDDVVELAAIVMQLFGSGLLNRIGVDQAGIAAVVEGIYTAGVPEKMPDGTPRVVGIQQGWRLWGAIGQTERLVAGGDLKHDGSPLMAWCVGNARVEPRANSRLITKQASGTAKIDPLMALFDAVSLLSLNPESNVIGEDFELMTI